jgi:hypothetical protein
MSPWRFCYFLCQVHDSEAPGQVKEIIFVFLIANNFFGTFFFQEKKVTKHIKK